MTDYHFAGTRASFDYDVDGCYTHLGMRFNTLLSNSWDETIFNAKFAIEQHMDGCVRQLLQIKSFIEAVPEIAWNDPSATVMNGILEVFKATTLNVVTVG